VARAIACVCLCVQCGKDARACTCIREATALQTDGLGRVDDIFGREHDLKLAERRQQHLKLALSALEGGEIANGIAK